MVIKRASSVALSLTANTGTIDFTGSTGTVTMVNEAARGTVTNDGGITWVNDGADCTITSGRVLVAVFQCTDGEAMIELSDPLGTAGGYSFSGGQYGGATSTGFPPAMAIDTATVYTYGAVNSNLRAMEPTRTISVSQGEIDACLASAPLNYVRMGATFELFENDQCSGTPSSPSGPTFTVAGSCANYDAFPFTTTPDGARATLPCGAVPMANTRLPARP